MQESSVVRDALCARCIRERNRQAEGGDAGDCCQDDGDCTARCSRVVRPSRWISRLRCHRTCIGRNSPAHEEIEGRIASSLPWSLGEMVRHASVGTLILSVWIRASIALLDLFLWRRRKS